MPHSTSQSWLRLARARLSALAKTPLVAALLIPAGCTQPDASGPPDPPRPPDLTTDRAVFEEKGMALSLGTPSDPTALDLTVPIGNPGKSAVPGTMTVTLRDLAGKKIDALKRDFLAAPGGSNVPLVLDGLPEATTQADLAQYLLEYRVEWENGVASGTRSAFDTLRKLAVVLMTDSQIEVGSRGHVTLFAIDPATNKALVNSKVELILTSADGKSTKVDAVTDASGKASAEVTPPEGAEGDATLTVRVVNGATIQNEDVAVKLVRSRKVLVTTDKPLYLPGQLVNVRALALRTTDKTPEAHQPVVFEIEDGKGNKIARESITTDAFGIAATTIQLARSVNLGTWKIRAVLGDTTSEKTITVDRYVLPKFKVSASLDQTWYRPGADVTVTGDARYFFGKAVDGGDVRIVASTFDIDFTQFAEVTTTTDADGLFSAVVRVPNQVVGLPLEQGKGLMKIDVSVVDGADHTQTVARTASIAKGGVDVTLIPESGKLVSGLANDVFVVTTDPNGGAVAAKVELALAGDAAGSAATVETNAQGLGTIALVPDGAGTATFDVTVTANGEKLTLKKTIAVGADTDTVLLRTDKAVYHEGDTAELDVRLADGTDRVYVDVVHNGRTVLLDSVDVAGGVGQWAFDIDGTLSGEVLVSAYYVTDRGTLVRDQRLLYVQPASELTVALTPRKASYVPGEKATIDVHVTDQNGKGVPAAVGLQVVDEAVFALQEVTPGLLKIFFSLAQELAAPTIAPACGGCDAETVIRGDEQTAPGYDDKARVAFASLGDMPLHAVEKNTFAAQASAAKAVLKPFFDAEKTRVVTELSDLAVNGFVTFENIGDYLPSASVAGVDFWGYPYTVTTDDAAQKATFVSMGPDERAGTEDDATFDVNYWEALRSNRGGWGWGGDAEMDGDFAQPGARPTAANGPPQDPGGEVKTGGGATPVKVRDYFPETLYVNPALITDGSGAAAVDIDLADSITTWRMTGLASSKDGLLGSGTGGILVFQDFFADIDFPVALTRNDTVTVPVALYNYLPTAQTVTLDLVPASWFVAQGPMGKTLTLQPNEVTAVTFNVKAVEVGVHGLTVNARGTTLSDALRRTVDVRPDGKEIPFTDSARFTVAPDGSATRETVRRTITIPPANIDNAQQLNLKVFPGFMSQVVDGIDSLLRLPGGCFEQTTSSAWPNVLVTDYLGKTGAMNPELELKARGYIAQGYQHLLTFECASGGFNWWEGDDPGNAVLSAVGIMMFTDTKNVAFVDDGVIARAAAYLARSQQSDGSWTEERHLHAGNENLGAGSLRATAYIAWALQHGEREAATVAKAIGYLRAHAAGATDVYTVAMVSLALAMNDRGDAALNPLLAKIHAAAIAEGTNVHWSPTQATMVGGYDNSGDIETTAIVSLALMQAQAYSADVQGALNWLIGKKDAQGNWGYSTQATVLTLKALIASLSAAAPTTAATVRVLLDGQEVGTREFTDFNADVLWQVELSDKIGEGAHEVTLEFDGTGNLMWQLAGAHYLPWTDLPAEPASPLAIDVAYDKTKLAADDVINVTVTVTNSDAETTGMMMAEMGLPPGFDLDTSALDPILGQGKVARYERSATKLIVYLEPVAPGSPVVFGYALHARYPLEATAPESETYLYYNKAVRAGTKPVALVVQ